MKQSKKFRKRMRKLRKRIRKNPGNRFGVQRKECKRCGFTRNLTVHHKVKQADGGTDDKNNLEVLCFECHKEVHKNDKKD